MGVLSHSDGGHVSVTGHIGEVGAGQREVDSVQALWLGHVADGVGNGGNKLVSRGNKRRCSW